MEIQTSKVKYQDDDVIKFEKYLYCFSTVKTGIKKGFEQMKKDFIIASILDYISSYGEVKICTNEREKGQDLLEKAINYQALRTDKPGWRKGKLKIKIIIDIEMEETEPDQPESPLDDIRQKM